MSAMSVAKTSTAPKPIELGRVAVQRVLRKQIEAGIDIGNDGEQRRDSFHLHIRRRLGGLGGTWERPPRADVERYPIFKQMRARLATVEIGRESEPVADGHWRGSEHRPEGRRP